MSEEDYYTRSRDGFLIHYSRFSGRFYEQAVTEEPEKKDIMTKLFEFLYPKESGW